MGQKTGRPRGRPAGAKNKRTEDLERHMAAAAERVQEVIEGAFEGDAHTLLMTVYKDPQHEWSLRLDAAKAAIRYEKPALSSIEATGKDGAPLNQVTLFQLPDNGRDAA